MTPCSHVSSCYDDGKHPVISKYWFNVQNYKGGVTRESKLSRVLSRASRDDV